MEKENKILSIAKETEVGQIVVEMATEARFTMEEKSIFIDSIGIIGDQKMGKSTLLNNLFGANFEVGSQLHKRTTEGINGQLLDIIDTIDEKIMILDCEGANSHQKEEKIKAALHKLNQSQEKDNFTETEIINQSKTLAIASDTRYTLFLWCSIDCLIYLIPDKPPTSIDIHFFISISENADIIKKSQHKPSVILAYPKKEKDDQLEESYLCCLREYAPTIQGLCHLQFAPFRKFRKSAQEEKYQASLRNFKKLIFDTIRSNKTEVFSLQSWCETLTIIAKNLDYKYELPDIRCLRAQLELKFIISHYGKELVTIANSLEQMIQIREEYDQTFSLSSYNKFLLDKRCCLLHHSEEEQNGRIIKTLLNINGLMHGVASLIFPPAIIISLLSTVLSIYTEKDMNKGKEEVIDIYLKGFQKTLDELKKFQEIIGSYLEAFKTAKNTLHLHEYYVNMIEFFYGIARKMLSQSQQNPKPEEIVQYMFKLFEDDNQREELERREVSEIKLEENKFKTFHHLTFLHFKPVGQALRAISATVRYYSSVAPDVFKVFKFGGIAFSGVLDLVDIYKTWNRQDVRTLFDAYKDHEKKLEDFANSLEDFTQQNRQSLEEIANKANQVLSSLSFKNEQKEEEFSKENVFD